VPPRLLNHSPSSKKLKNKMNAANAKSKNEIIWIEDIFIKILKYKDNNNIFKILKRRKIINVFLFINLIIKILLSYR